MAHHQPRTLREKSTWTPMNYSSGNQKIFSERMALIKKWHASWNNDQKWVLIEYVLRHLTDAQLLMVCSLLQPLMMPPEMDFTIVLPRHICLKIMSYLDPRSLCRAAQVSWHWKYLTEHNNVWQAKCITLGWFLPSPPNQYDIAVWKRHYIACITQLYWKPPQTSHETKECMEVMEDLHTPTRYTESVFRNEKRVYKNRVSVHSARKPWKDPDRHPEDAHFQHHFVHHLDLAVSSLPHFKQQSPLLNTKNPGEGNAVELSETQNMPLHPVLLEKMRLSDTEQNVTDYPFPSLPTQYYSLPKKSRVSDSVVSELSSSSSLKADLNSVQSKDSTQYYTTLTSKPWNVYGLLNENSSL